ncbi:Protein of unknown function DUF3669 zinc finger protein [Penicillium cf. viridicatum]|uniref:DUF3669 domain-containing protein n=1 Tax=Penicillium cf. viridicatum TaxID=2972119 RepID=A0A9W9M8D4_9EURO|nr:Protein of unknown function DUF3669 zinc finger protein [Penicillium cf. viridicatum]
MDRREQASTDESEYSIAEFKDLPLTSLHLAKDHFFSPEDLTSIKPEQILARMLSTKSYILTASSLAELNNVTRGNASQQRFLEIGKGQCGTVYALLGTDTVAKIPNSAEKVCQLLTDFEMHTRIIEAMTDVETGIDMGIKIPKLYRWATPNSKNFWSNYGLRFAQNVDAQNFAIISSRVFPIPFPIREAIVDVLCPRIIQRQKAEFLAKPENQNCLIRTYLGRRLTSKGKTSLESFKLQNFPLHVNEMEDLQLVTSSFAQVMAQTLAILHWKAGVDGNDIEFILGSAPLSTQMRADEIDEDNEWSLGERFDFCRRSISLWLIDFNQCAKFEDTDAGLKKTVDAFIWNNPYYPSPSSTMEEDKKLWRDFSQRYLDVSRMLTTSTTPHRFITEVEKQGRKGTVDELF